MLSRSYPFTLYVSSTLPSLSLLTLSKAFSWSTKTRFSSRLNSIAFSLSCRSAKMTYLHPLPFLKPICTSLSSGFTVYLVRTYDMCVYFACVTEKRYSPVCAAVVLAAFLFSDLYNYCTLRFSHSRPSGILW